MRDMEGIPTLVVTAAGAAMKSAVPDPSSLGSNRLLQVALRAKANASPAGEAF